MRRSVAAAFALLFSMFAAPCLAQTAPPPRFQEVDGNGVDLISGRFVFTMTEGTIGAGEGAVTLERGQRNDYGRTDQWSGLLYRRTAGGTTLIYVQFGNRADTFTISGSTYSSTTGNGATLTGDITGYTYRASDGTTVLFDGQGPDLGYPYVGPGCTLADPGTCALPMAVARPDGTSFTLNWTIIERCHEYDPELNCLQPNAYFRFDGVTSSTGYSFSFTYVSNSPGLPSSAPPPAWYQRTGATFTNNVTAPSPLPAVTYATPSGGVEEVTDTGGRTWRITRSGDNIVGLRRPGSTTDDITISYGTGGVVTSVTRDGVATNYARSVVGSNATTTITNALSQQTVVVADLSKERITSVTDPLGRTTSFQYDTQSRLTRATMPEGNYLTYSYDARGNVTQTSHVPKGGSGSPTITTSASYPATCADPVTCNRPTTTTDARGNVTAYQWSATHGGLVSVTAPAPTSGATQPQTRYAYTLTNGEYRLTSISACSTGTVVTCVNTANESRTVLAYDANGNVTSVTRRDGTGSLTSTRTMTYDPIGNLLTVDGPLSGAGDTTRYRYNAARQVVGVIGPDPDGAGSLKHRAVRTTYRADGLPTVAERGTVNGYSDADWAAFVSLEQVETDYDANDRPVVQRLESGGTPYALSQTSYDALGRPQCIAQRMNPAIFTSLPSSACTLGTEGSFGPDRIVRTTYDAASQVTLVQTGYGVTGVQANEVATAYTNNGRVAHVIDGESNRTTYEYDGLDRLVKTRFPITTQGANQSSATDYEQLTLDANGNATTRRLRDGTSIAFTFDALNRPTFKNLPGSEPDVTYAYDLLGRLTSASQTGNSVSITYDALGRTTSQTGTHGTLTSTFDAADRRTRLDYPGGFFVTYDYHLTGEMTRIRESGTTDLATFAYDDRGRRSSLTYGNGATATYGYDPVSRLASLAIGLAGTTDDQNLGFSHNPAGQIVTNTRSNDAYSFTGLANANRTDAHNGLNQIATTGGTALTHDARGNITNDGARTYSYSSENLLTSAGGVGTFAYDPLLRLVQSSGSGARFAYDGAVIAEEYDDAGVRTARYVHGPSIDEPLVWYDAAGTRRYLQADERGSIVATSTGTGAIHNIGTYDEYGMPGQGNTGRFGYTGQAWLPEAGLHYYKARMYSPVLGRFMQTDPIGYRSGMNLYTYVLGDPINLRDPSGLLSSCVEITVTWHWYSPEGEYYGPTDDPPEHYRWCPRSVLPSSFLGGGGGIGSGSDVGDGTLPDCATIGREGTPDDMAAATNLALQQIYGNGLARASTVPLSSGFSQVERQPDFSDPSWRATSSTHSSFAFERSIPGSWFVLKIYLGDRMHNNLNTATITHATGSFSHYFNYAPWRIGMPVNERNAAIYRREVARRNRMCE